MQDSRRDVRVCVCETQLLFGLLVRPGPISVFGVLYASKNSVSTWEKYQRRYFRAMIRLKLSPGRYVGRVRGFDFSEDWPVSK